MLDEAFETIDEVEGLLAGVAEGAPPDLVEPALVALTSGGKRLRPLLLVLSAHMGEPEREDLLRAVAAIEVCSRPQLAQHRAGHHGVLVVSEQLLQRLEPFA